MITRQTKTMDGNTAAAHVAYEFTEVAAIYPITPSSVMAEVVDEWATAGRKNLFGQQVKIMEMQSEGGASGTVHGSLAAGALTTTFTASQGLLLMIPNMYKIAGEMLPGVIHVSARALASHALSIFGDHSDVYACRQTGFAMLAESNPQEVMDLAAVAHLAAIKGRLPVLNFFDGFRTSHEIQKIKIWGQDELRELADFDAINEFRNNALNPEHPVQRGSAQNPDIFFQAREASNAHYDAFPAIVEEYMDKVNEMIGTSYHLFDYYGDPEAEHVIVAMGSVCDTICEVVDALRAEGMKVGLVMVRLYRPFAVDRFVAALPKTVKRISVLDRTKEPGSVGEPLYLDVCAALAGTEFANVKVVGGRYGMGSKDTVPSDILAVYENEDKDRFTIGIDDDVTYLSLKASRNIDTTPEGNVSCKFWGLGSDGTVGANKNSIKIIGDHTDQYAQGYFEYDSKKSGGLTISHLRFGKKPIRSTYFVHAADFVACHNPSYVTKYDIVQEIKDGGTFLLNCGWTPEELDEKLPAKMRSFIAKHNIRLFLIDGMKIGREIGLGGRINTVLQAAFFQLAKVIPAEEASEYMKAAAKASYGSKGDDIVQMNYDAIDAGMQQVKEVEVPAYWADAVGEEPEVEVPEGELGDFVKNIQIPVNAHDGDALPVSKFVKYADGTTPSGTAAFEKRGIAQFIPAWNPEKCIQCAFCSYVCPHAAIRVVAMTADEAAAAPEVLKSVDMKNMDGYKFAITVAPYDCTGCGSCINVCPGTKGEKALSAVPFEDNTDMDAGFEYAISLPDKNDVVERFGLNSVKGSQFRRPLFEFSGACAGCGETPYVKLITQLCGERMYVANATGCSSIWGNSAPSTPYTKAQNGRGPAWSNSLFEDNAEFGLGMYLANEAIRERLKDKVTALCEAVDCENFKALAAAYLESFDNGAANTAASDALVAALEKMEEPLAKEILTEKDYLAKKSQWIFGGDGWAYDIGYGGLDHVLASGKDVNVLVLDTEVYSNTGGQSSKSTPIGAVAQFAAGGKEMGKKDLAGMAMNYGYVYVAQIAMGANYNQCVKAIAEAEAYPGPSLIIAYAPCINHGVRKGMSKAQTEEKLAVEAGYWHLFRFDPRKGEDAFQLDSKEPKGSYREFITGETRYSSLMRKDPERAEMLFTKAEEAAKTKYANLVKKAEK